MDILSLLETSVPEVLGSIQVQQFAVHDLCHLGFFGRLLESLNKSSVKIYCGSAFKETFVCMRS